MFLSILSQRGTIECSLGSVMVWRILNQLNINPDKTEVLLESRKARLRDWNTTYAGAGWAAPWQMMLVL